MHLDIVPRFKIINSKISMSELSNQIKLEKLLTKLVHLQNGEIFNVNDN